MQNIVDNKFTLEGHGSLEWYEQGVGFVEFSTTDEASAAMLKMNGKMVGKKPIYVSLAQRKEERKLHLQPQFSNVVLPTSQPFLHQHLPVFSQAATSTTALPPFRGYNNFQPQIMFPPRMPNVPRTRVERLIGWTAPSTGWFKLNSDGASRGNPGLAAAGGVLRDGNGRWYGGFSLHIGRCTAPLAELWGVYYGLVMAWEKKITKLEVEVDSELVVGILKQGIAASHPLSFLARMCHGFLLKDWEVRISHVFREANRVADGLANLAFTLSLGFHLFDVVPSSLESLLWEDEIGVTYPRLVMV
ncbi:unnamed protein product [Microthlaspi erraticum]|uniref:RRM domain-containing protein n=1 Tax=Microthlaspi erraticum TaxID=1685480 RepID=A0A6D2I0B9_9BRAS|nr:unnamed protein product [Microthlaspi erraticum]